MSFHVFCKRYLSIAKTFVEGDVAVLRRRITMEDVKQFTGISGDTNPIHDVDAKEKAIVHGALLNSILSGVIGTKLPGHGTVVVAQNLHFPNKCYVDDVVTFRVELVENRKIMKIKFACEVDVEKKLVLYGDAKVIVKRI